MFEFQISVASKSRLIKSDTGFIAGEVIKFHYVIGSIAFNAQGLRSLPNAEPRAINLRHDSEENCQPVDRQDILHEIIFMAFFPRALFNVSRN